MTDTDRRARSRGREREAMPDAGPLRDANGPAAGDGASRKGGRVRPGRGTRTGGRDAHAAGGGAGGGPTPRTDAASADGGVGPAVPGMAAGRVRSPEPQRALLQGGQLRFEADLHADAYVQPGAGHRKRHYEDSLRTPTTPEVAAFVAAMADDEDARRWCVLTLAGALRPGVVTSARRWRIDPEAGALIHEGGRYATAWRGHPATEVLLPPCALAEAAAWTDEPWRGPEPGRFRRRFERHRRTSAALFVTPSSFRRFVFEELWRRAPGLVPHGVAAWLGLRRRTWNRFQPHCRADVAAVLRAVDDLVRDLDRRSGGTLLRAGPGDGEKAG
ncbi:hypothetical protein AwMethylo_00380 [Methylobacterium sp.]|nr:hypothetical protein AwMethylo_00380 [Methylobacterium sp.]